MANPFFQFKQFTVQHDRCAMKVTTDSCLFGGWIANQMQNVKCKIEEVLDIGTGTGLLPLMIAQKNELFIDAVEIEPAAAQQANENVKASPWPGRIKVVNADILSFQPGKKYDCIISNPPFYENELISEQAQKNLAHHSSRLTIGQVIQTVNKHLKQNGLFFLMYPSKRKEEIEKQFSQNDLFVMRSVILKQSTNHSPFRVLVMGTNKKLKTEQIELSVWNDQQQYTKEFTDLLRDYYLYL